MCYKCLESNTYFIDSIKEILHDLPSRRESNVQAELGIRSSRLYVSRRLDETNPSLSTKWLDCRITLERRCSVDKIDDPTRKKLEIDRMYCT